MLVFVAYCYKNYGPNNSTPQEHQTNQSGAASSAKKVFRKVVGFSSLNALANVGSWVQKQKNCTICFEAFDNDCTVLNCGHAFHSKCINEWASQNVEESITCPTCRSPAIVTVSEQDQISLKEISISNQNNVEVVTISGNDEAEVEPNNTGASDNKPSVDQDMPDNS